MTEAVVQFGPANGLIGIVTQPDGGTRATFACLLINAGVIHRIGPHRLNVKIARALATIDVMSLRMDLSGLGDSAPARSDKDFWDQAVVDLQSAMDLMERVYGIRDFVVLGVCSGAVNGYWLAKADRRIVGLLMFDGFAYPTWRTALVRRWTRIRKLPWSSVLAGGYATGKRLVGRAVLGDGERQSASVTRHPSKEEFGATMQEFVERGVAVFLAYSHTVEQHNYAAQLSDTYPRRAFLRHIRYEYVPEIDAGISQSRDAA